MRGSGNERSEMEKTAESSLTEQVHIVMSEDINGAGRLFGGRLVEWIDEVAGIVGLRHSGHNVTTASIENLQFKEGAHIGEIIVLIGRVVYTGQTSMEVRIDTYREELDGMRYPINRAYFTMVALDGQDKPVAVPGLRVESEAERAEWAYALARRESRKKRKAEGFFG